MFVTLFNWQKTFMSDWCHCALAAAIIIFIITLIVFFKRISVHAIQGNGFYDYNKMLDLTERQIYGAGTDKRPWIMDHETNRQCPPAYCS